MYIHRDKAHEEATELLRKRSARDKESAREIGASEAEDKLQVQRGMLFFFLLNKKLLTFVFKKCAFYC